MYCAECYIQDGKGTHEAQYLYNGKSLCNVCFWKEVKGSNLPAKVEDKPKGKRGSRLPESWVPKTETIEAICTELGVTQEPLVQEHRRFCDYWYGVAGQRGVKLDWDATWRNWMRKAYEQGNLGGLTRTSTEKKMNGYVDRSARLAQQARDAVEIEDARSQS